MEETLREIQAHSFIYKFDICALLRNYAARKGNYFPTFRDNIWDPTGCPETSENNYHYALRIFPEERISHFLRGGSLKSRIVWLVHVCPLNKSE
jgi:hypothetical protein